jgi:hypothetical protein
MNILGDTAAEQELKRKLEQLLVFILFFAIGYLAIVLPVFIIEYFTEVGSVNAGNTPTRLAPDHSHTHWLPGTTAFNAFFASEDSRISESDEPCDTGIPSADDLPAVVEIVQDILGDAGDGGPE